MGGSRLIVGFKKNLAVHRPGYRVIYNRSYEKICEMVGKPYNPGPMCSLENSPHIFHRKKTTGMRVVPRMESSPPG